MLMTHIYSLVIIRQLRKGDYEYSSPRIHNPQHSQIIKSLFCQFT